MLEELEKTIAENYKQIGIVIYLLILGTTDFIFKYLWIFPSKISSRNIFNRAFY